MGVQLELIQVSESDLQTETVSREKNRSQVRKSLLPDLARSETKFLRLVDRVIVGGIIPFLGAGLTLLCEGPDGNTIARTSEMICSVCRQLHERDPRKSRCRVNSNSSCCNELRDSPNDQPESESGRPCGKKRGLAETCEEYLWNSGDISTLVLEVLNMEEFTELEISRAHRYIAYLARESVIEEAITTNYDTSLERAYDESLNEGHGGNRKFAHSVSSLQRYREVAGIRQENDQPPPLKVYHINGCALDLQGVREAKAHKRKEICSTILLTERQLQDWRDRQWGRDLLRDRLRCKNIVFSGFGSPEPQVRHTVLQVLEEFELNSAKDQSKHKRTNGEKPGWDAPNAVFVHAYEGLTFEHKQMLMAYANTSGTNTTTVKSIKKSGNCFTPDDASLFVGELRNCLAADDFWRQVYKAVFWRLLTRGWLSYGSPFYYLMLLGISCADVLLSQVRNWLLPDSGTSSRFETLFGWFSKYLDIPCDGCSTLLSKHMWYARYRGRPFQPGWYASLNDRGIMISSYFVLVYVLTMGFHHSTREKIPSWADIEKMVTCSESMGLGLEFPLGHVPSHKGLLLFGHRESLFQPGERIDGDMGNHNIIIQVVIDSSFISRKVRVQLRKKQSASVQEVKYVSIYQISFLDLFGRARRKPTNVTAILETVRGNLVFPSLAMDRSKMRVRNKTFIRGD